MTEKQKMLAGELYNAMDRELLLARTKAKALIFKINQTPWENTEKKQKLFKDLFMCSRSDFHIEAPFFCDYGPNISFGTNFYANHNCVILDVNKVVIGDHVKLGPNVQIYTASHPLNPLDRSKGLEFGLPVTIADKAWIGGAAVICPGITIGEGSVIGAGSVVTKNIPPGVLAAGNPCRIIRELK